MGSGLHIYTSPHEGQVFSVYQEGLAYLQAETSNYDPEKRAFIFNFGTERDRPSHTGYNSWGIHLDKVTRNSDGTVTAVLVNYDSYQTRSWEF